VGPKLSTPEGVKEVLKNLSNEDKKARKNALKQYTKVCEKHTNYVDAEGVGKINQLMIDEEVRLQENALGVYKIILERAPQFITGEGLMDIIDLMCIMKDKNEVESHGMIVRTENGKCKVFGENKLANRAFEIYKIAVKKRLKLIPDTLHYLFNVNLFPDATTEKKIFMLQMLQFALEEAPQYFHGFFGDQVLISCFASGNPSVQLEFENTIELALETKPEAIDSYFIMFLVGRFLVPDKKVQQATFNTLKLIVDKYPKACDNILKAFQSGDLPKLLRMGVMTPASMMHSLVHEIKFGPSERKVRKERPKREALPPEGLSERTRQAFMKIDKIPQICGNCNLFKIPGPNPFGEADSGFCTKRNTVVEYKDRKCPQYKINLVLPLVIPNNLYKPEVFDEFMRDPLSFMKKAFEGIDDEQYLLQFAQIVMMNKHRVLGLNQYF